MCDFGILSRSGDTLYPSVLIANNAERQELSDSSIGIEHTWCRIADTKLK